MNVLLRNYCLFLLSFLVSCNFFTQKDTRNDKEKVALARVKDNYLFTRQLPSYVRSFKGKDSIVVIGSYRDKWIRKQLLTELAVETVSDDEEIRKKVEKFREELLVSEFRKRYIEKHLDSTITEADLKKFAENNPVYLTNHEDLVKGYFLKVPSNAPELKEIKKSLGTEENDKLIQSFCIRYAKSYKLNSWFPLHQVLEQTAFRYEEKKTDDFANGKLFEKTDTEYTYLLYIKEKRKAGEKAPVEYIEPLIRSLIYTERKNQLLESLENELYTEGKKSGQVEVF